MPTPPELMGRSRHAMPEPLPLPTPDAPHIAAAVQRVRSLIQLEKDALDIGSAMRFTSEVMRVAAEEAGYAERDASKPT